MTWRKFLILVSGLSANSRTAHALNAKNQGSKPVDRVIHNPKEAENYLLNLP